jgi:N utilization substance protein B
VGVRRAGRELALQALYSLDLNPTNSKVMLQQFWENFQESAAIREFAGELVEGVVTNREVIQKRIKSQSKNWSLSRMAKVDLNILRIGVYELLFRSDIPKNVTINEAIEVAKKFGTEESPAFINGILDEIAASLPDKQ